MKTFAALFSDLLLVVIGFVFCMIWASSFVTLSDKVPPIMLMPAIDYIVAVGIFAIVAILLRLNYPQFTPRPVRITNPE